MPKTDSSIDAKLQRLNEHAFGKDAKNDEAVVAAALGDKHARVAARAAKIAEERLMYSAIAPLKTTFERFVKDGVRRDPQCLAKQSICRALVALDCCDAAFYRSGIVYTQMEPVWGGSADTAVDVRVSCAMGLANSGDPRALHDIAVLLNDSEVRARIGAARAAACGKPSEAELLLRFKIIVGDKEPEVLGECFASLLQLVAAEALPLIARHLNERDEAVAEQAAIALGESRLTEALPFLKEAWDSVALSPSFRRSLARAVALQRNDAAFDWLLKLIAEGSQPSAECAVEALSIYKDNVQLAGRVRAALMERKSVKLNAFFEQVWR